MKKNTYILISILTGWLAYFILPMKEPALTYFVGVFIGVIALFFIKEKKYTHDIWVHIVLWSVVIVIFPEYIFTGLAVGCLTHLVLKMLEEKVNIQKFGFYKQWLAVMGLVAVNSVVAISVFVEKLLNY